MPLTAKGKKIEAALQERYGEKRGTSILYAGKNKGTFTGIDGTTIEDLNNKDQLAGIASYAARSVGQSLGTTAMKSIGGGSGSGAMIGATMLSPMTSTPTASQAQENAVMGRPAGASAFGNPPRDVRTLGGNESQPQKMGSTTSTAPSGMTTGIRGDQAVGGGGLGSGGVSLDILKQEAGGRTPTSGNAR